ncbi:hypothetical protein NE237_023547 [Protea cynaroides]|uniref:DUF1990 domain-containing protein n=1 Tax=Protea cynaroides TaxID=273540 RepID=A0A9Q0HF62_9MAGN|nr:hypothetical protein NE237_023547 [Protea cynaroides]
MVFFCWNRPSLEVQKDCVNKSGSFNYDTKYRGATAKPLSSLQQKGELAKDGFFVNHSRVLVGSGHPTYEKAKNALQSWRHFALNWAFVNPKTPIQTETKFCVCVKQFLPWMLMPLQVSYITEVSDRKKHKASFGFGSGTLQGHLLAGEERFSVEMDENDQVWNLLRLKDPFTYREGGGVRGTFCLRILHWMIRSTYSWKLLKSEQSNLLCV